MSVALTHVSLALRKERAGYDCKRYLQWIAVYRGFRLILLYEHDDRGGVVRLQTIAVCMVRLRHTLRLNRCHA
jgi:hypothetical protein